MPYGEEESIPLLSMVIQPFICGSPLSAVGNKQPDESRRIAPLGLRIGRFVPQLTCVIVVWHPYCYCVEDDPLHTGAAAAGGFPANLTF